MSTKNTLPLMCYASLTNGETVQIKYGAKGYFKDLLYTNQSHLKHSVEHLNENIGVTKEQADIMKGGSMFGWDIPLVTNYLSQ